MIGAIRASATGLQGQQNWIDASANNLANVNTTAFKRNQVEFQDLLYVSRRFPGGEVAQGAPSPTGTQVGAGVVLAAADKVFTTGPLENTGGVLDVAIEGKGFFQVALPDGGIRYTRDGTFTLNAAGLLTTADGLTVQPPVTIPAGATSLSIGADGTVSALLPGQTTPQQLGRLNLVNFRNPSGLSSEGRNLYAQTASSGDPLVGFPGQNGTGFLRQGFLERSNVEVVQELTNLILAQRAYVFNAQAIQTASEMLQSTTDLIA